MKASTTIVLLGAIAAGFALHAAAADKEAKKVDGRVFELRTYYAPEGKMEALKARFRDHTNKLFEKHGMTIIGFWTPTKPEDAQKKLIYLLAFPSEQAALRSWNAFLSDPEWIAARKESEKNGKLTEDIQRVFLNPTDFSPLK
jgi:hypothetical protein